MKKCVLWLLAVSLPPGAANLLAGDTWTYWVQPCTAEVAAESHCKAGDAELARWALDAWQRASDGALQVQPAAAEQGARLRIYWVTGRSQLYGEARPIRFGAKRGSEVYVLPSAARTGEDPLDRETIVYLTCLHETGHALGLAHTDQFADIMYSFQFGGDIPEYFARYRRKLKIRADIAQASAISPADHAALAPALAIASRPLP